MGRGRKVNDLLFVVPASEYLPFEEPELGPDLDTAPDPARGGMPRGSRLVIASATRLFGAPVPQDAEFRLRTA